MNSFFEPVILLKMNFLLGIFQDFCLKVSVDFFYHGTFMFLKNILCVCSKSKYNVHGFLKIIQNYVNNKINN